MSDNDDPSHRYDQVVYYVAPAVLIAAILFCCFRMALVYYMQIRPRRNQQATDQVAPRESVLQEASSAFPTSCQSIFSRVPPPNYQETIKNDRRSMSANELNTTNIANSLTTTEREIQQIDVPTDIVVVPTSINLSDSQNARREAIRRVQSNIETMPPIILGPPAYSNRRLSTESLDSEMLSPYTRTTRLPTYDEAISDNDQSRRPTLNDS